VQNNAITPGSARQAQGEHKYPKEEKKDKPDLGRGLIYNTSKLSGPQPI
jgi:hypothetical protein